LLAVALVVLAAALFAVSRSEMSSRGRQYVGVPAYFYPTDANVEQWQRLRDGFPAVRVAIATGLGLDGDSPIAAYQREITLTHEAGVLILAYVTTREPDIGPTRAAADITSEIDRAYEWYGTDGVLDGIFFDEAVDYPVTCDQRALFADLDRHVKAKGGRAMTVLNHGQVLPECYATAADILVNAETTYDLYQRWQPWGWEKRYPATKFWHIVHGATAVEQMRDVVALSRRRNAGTIYVTGAPAQEPYAALPEESYWAGELSAVTDPGGGRLRRSLRTSGATQEQIPPG